MASTKDKKDKMNESGSTQQERQNPNDRNRDKQNPEESEGTPRDKSREQTAGTGRKME